MKKLFALFLMVVMCFSLVACGGEKKEEASFDTKLEGTYARSHIADGKEIISVISLYEDGIYQRLVIWDDYIKSCTTGDYELVDGEIRLYDPDISVPQGSATLYTFEKGNLVGAGSVYKKISEN